MSLAPKEIISLKKEIIKKCNITTKQKEALRLYCGFDGKNNRTMEDIQKIMRIKNVKVTDAIIFPLIKLRKFFKNKDIDKEDIESILYEIFNLKKKSSAFRRGSQL